MLHRAARGCHETAANATAQRWNFLLCCCLIGICCCGRHIHIVEFVEQFMLFQCSIDGLLRYGRLFNAAQKIRGNVELAKLIRGLVRQGLVLPIDQGCLSLHFLLEGLRAEFILELGILIRNRTQLILRETRAR